MTVEATETFENDAGKDTVVWVHSGGTDPDSGLPSHASLLRLRWALSTLKYRVGGGRVFLLVSGEETRKSGPGSQGRKLADWCKGLAEFSDYRVEYTELSMEETFKLLVRESGNIESVLFVNDDVHVSRYAYMFAMLDAAFYRKVMLVPVPVMGDLVYAASYSAPYMACYNALVWLRMALKQVSVFQFVLFGLDRAFNKPSRNPLKRAVTALVTRFIRNDLR